MYILIDYENVNETALAGVELLEQQDSIMFFYGDENAKMPDFYMKKIIDSGCEFNIYKIKKAEKNGVDFCIATEIGSIIGRDSTAKIAIISKDKGYQSIIDYCSQKSRKAKPVVKCNNIFNAFTSGLENGLRKQKAMERTKKVDLVTGYQTYSSRKSILQRLEEDFVNTEYEDCIFELVELLESEGKSTLKQFYITLLKKFGRKRGVFMYRKLKNYV